MKALILITVLFAVIGSLFKFTRPNEASSVNLPTQQVDVLRIESVLSRLSSLESKVKTLESNLQISEISFGTGTGNSVILGPKAEQDLAYTKVKAKVEKGDRLIVLTNFSVNVMPSIENNTTLVNGALEVFINSTNCGRDVAIFKKDDTILQIHDTKGSPKYEVLSVRPMRGGASYIRHHPEENKDPAGWSTEFDLKASPGNASAWLPFSHVSYFVAKNDTDETFQVSLHSKYSTKLSIHHGRILVINLGPAPVVDPETK